MKTAIHSSILFACVLTIGVRAGNLKTKGKNIAAVNFTENKGQVHDQFGKSRPDVLFGGTDGALVFHLRNNGISYQLERVGSWRVTNAQNTFEKMPAGKSVLVPAQSTFCRLDINWLNANSATRISRGEALDGYSDYFGENCAAGILNVKSYADITYYNLYPGIDLKWYQVNGHLKYDYLVAAGADYKKILLEVNGAQELRLDADGQLVIKTMLGDVIEEAPVVRQSGGVLKSKWLIQEAADKAPSILSFEIENIDPQAAFTIDPIVRVWGTYYGGTGGESGACVTDQFGNVYLGGLTSSTTGTIIATSGSCQDTYFGGSMDAYLAKFNSSGQRLWATYYGGSGDDYAVGIAIDNAGNAYISGSTTSAGGIMATANGHQTNYGGNGDAFLTKFDPNGGLLWSTYYGGSGTDYGYACSVDPTGNVYMNGNTGSTSGIATAGAHEGLKTAFSTAFLVKFNSAGIRQWGTYYGGSNGVRSTSCITDKQGNVYLTGVAGTSTGTEVATPGTHQPAYAGGTGADGVLVKFNASGVRQWGTYFGGTGDDSAKNCFADSVGNIFLTGATKSISGISTPGVHQTALGGNIDGYLVKFNISGQRLWATYYGGTGDDEVGGCLDKYENILLFGGTSSNSGTAIATPGSFKPTYGGGTDDAFIAKLTPAGMRLWGTYYGGAADDGNVSVSLDNSGNLYLSGNTSTSGGTVIATQASHQYTYGGGDADAFLVKFLYCTPPLPVNVTPPENLHACGGNSATLIASATGTLSWYTNSSGGTAVGTGSMFATPSLTIGSYTYYVEAETCAPGEMRIAITLTVDACTGISSVSMADYQTAVYPNPFSRKIVVKCSSNEFIPLEMYNVSGSLVYESIMKKETEIDLESLIPGIYFVRIGSATKKIVKE